MFVSSFFYEILLNETLFLLKLETFKDESTCFEDPSGGVE